MANVHTRNGSHIIYPIKAGPNGGKIRKQDVYEHIMKTDNIQESYENDYIALDDLYGNIRK
jgi:hypothetical protein